MATPCVSSEKVGYTAADMTGIDASSLGIYWWNAGGWQLKRSSTVGTEAKTVSASQDHLSAFAVLGEAWKVYLPLATRSFSAGW